LGCRCEDGRVSDASRARSLLPRYARAWTDHNAHDPGITVLELMDGTQKQFDQVISTMPFTQLVKGLGDLLRPS
jgi:protoporphyrinogen oxidase